MIEVSELNRHPLKSGAANPLDSTKVEFSGIPYDRHLMVASRGGEYISQRQKGMQKLAVVTTHLDGDSATLSAPNMPDLRLELTQNSGPVLDIKLHDKVVQGLELGTQASDWISAYLPRFRGQDLLIVGFPPNYVRGIRGMYTDSETACTEFADGYPILICSEESLAELNQRLVAKGDEAINLDRFRANIIVKNLAPFLEDTFNEIAIGGDSGIILQIVKPCARCPVTGVDQSKGEFTAKPKEPRSTLETFHAGKHLAGLFPNLANDLMNQPMFGVYAIVTRPGIVRVGDGVEIISRRIAK